MVERLEQRSLMSVTLPTNPGMPQSSSSDNLLATFVSGSTQNGQLIAPAAQIGTWPTLVRFLVAASK